jgi:hypothetical protein
MFEMTASMLMVNEGKNQKFLKLPSFLKDSFGNGQNYLGIETGKKIREWLSKGEKQTPDIEKYKSEALLICEKGTEALTALWKSIPKQARDNEDLKNHFVICAESAKAYDSINNPDSENETSLLDSLIDLFEKHDKTKLSSDEVNNINRIIDEKEETNFAKAIELLKSKK